MSSCGFEVLKIELLSSLPDGRRSNRKKPPERGWIVMFMIILRIIILVLIILWIFTGTAA